MPQPQGWYTRFEVTGMIKGVLGFEIFDFGLKILIFFLLGVGGGGVA